MRFPMSLVPKQYPMGSKTLNHLYKNKRTLLLELSITYLSKLVFENTLDDVSSYRFNISFQLTGNPISFKSITSIYSSIKQSS